MAIFMVQHWKRITRQKTTHSFSAGRKISFPPLARSDGQENPIMIEAEVEGHLIHRMHVDGGSTSEVLYEHCFNKLHPEVKKSNGEGEHSTGALTNFMVVRSPSPYNGIIGRPGRRKVQAVPSTADGMLKFLVEEGIVTLRSNIIIPTECIMVVEAPNGSLPKEPTDGALQPAQRPLGHICLEADRHGRRSKIHSGTPLEYPRRMPAHKAIQEEVTKIVEARIMRDVHYHDWLLNSIMVKKHNGSRRMCVDFTDLNKSCPKDCYLLLESDWNVESFCRYHFRCFLDAYKGYHQIHMAEEDEEKTAFHISQGVFLLYKDAVRSQERWSNISAAGG
ncbi:hypothetical protein Tco_0666276 [Tanacetum coccineum]